MYAQSFVDVPVHKRQCATHGSYADLFCAKVLDNRYDAGTSGGLAWWLGVEIVAALGPEHAVTETRRIYDRVMHKDWMNLYGAPGKDACP